MNQSLEPETAADAIEQKAAAHRATLDDFTNPRPATPTRPVEPERPANFGSILRIPVMVQVVLGSATMPVANLMKLGRGAVIPLDHRVGEPVDIVVNNRVVARGEVVVVEDDNSRFGVSLTEIVGPANSETDV